jgi:transketolase
MGTINNGIALHGGLDVFGATFFVFSDYERPAIRLRALQGLPVVSEYTHDSIFVGEDGPTHQPIEQLMACRAIPNLLVLRPGDANEALVASRIAFEQTNRPALVLLTRYLIEIHIPLLKNLEKVGMLCKIVMERLMLLLWPLVLKFG